MCSLPTRPGREEKGALSNLIKTLLLSHNSSAYLPLFQASAKGMEKCQAFRMSAKKEQEKLNRGPHPSYPSARSDLLGLLSASQSFHTIFCPAIYLWEKQNCNSLSGCREGKKIHGGRQIGAAEQELCSPPPRLHMNDRTEGTCSLLSSLLINSAPKHITRV